MNIRLGQTEEISIRKVKRCPIKVLEISKQNENNNYLGIYFHTYFNSATVGQSD